MKKYPSIPSSMGQKFIEIHGAHIFDKIDGSSLRSEYTSKRGWIKHGRRNGLLDDSNIHLIKAQDLFMNTLAEPLAKIAHDYKIKHLIVFYEFAGPNSFAGNHDFNDEKTLTLFDAALNKGGLLDPVSFRNLFEDKVLTPKYLGQYNWTRDFVEQVRLNQIDGITFEGVVGKAGNKHTLIRAKAKTQMWIDKVYEKFDPARSRAILNS